MIRQPPIGSECRLQVSLPSSSPAGVTTPLMDIPVPTRGSGLTAIRPTPSAPHTCALPPAGTLPPGWPNQTRPRPESTSQQTERTSHRDGRRMRQMEDREHGSANASSCSSSTSSWTQNRHSSTTYGYCPSGQLTWCGRTAATVTKPRDTVGEGILNMMAEELL